MGHILQPYCLFSASSDFTFTLLQNLKIPLHQDCGDIIVRQGETVVYKKERDSGITQLELLNSSLHICAGQLGLSNFSSSL